MITASTVSPTAGGDRSLIPRRQRYASGPRLTVNSNAAAIEAAVLGAGITVFFLANRSATCLRGLEII